MSNKCIPVLVLLFLTVTLSAEAKVVGVVFHRSYCEKAHEAYDARNSYLKAVRNKGYDVVDLCSSTRSGSEVKRSIEAEAKKKNIKWTDIEGITIVGPVVSTLLDTTLSENSEQIIPSVSALVFDDFSFTYNDAYLTDVKSSYFMPSRARWVSQLFAVGAPSKQVADGLLKAEARLAAPEEASCGKRFSDQLLAGLNKRGARMTDDWSAYPYGLGWNLMTPLFTVSAWYITGASREAEGYSKTNRLQTTTDKLMYSLFIYPALTFFNVYSTYKLAGHIFGRSLPNDQPGWKRYVLNKRLLVDGLAKQSFCGKK